MIVKPIYSEFSEDRMRRGFDFPLMESIEFKRGDLVRIKLDELPNCMRVFSRKIPLTHGRKAGIIRGKIIASETGIVQEVHPHSFGRRITIFVRCGNDLLKFLPEELEKI